MTVTVEEAPARAIEAPLVEAAAGEPVAARTPVAAMPPAPPVDVPAAPAPKRVRPVLSVQTARLVGLGTFVAFWVAVQIEPVPDGAQPVMVWWAELLGYATLVVLLASWITLAAGRRSGLRLGAVAGASLVVQSALCPAMDHHTIAPWWFAQLAISAGMVAVCATVFARTRSARR